MLKLNVGKGHQVIKTAAWCWLVPRPREEAMQYYATVGYRACGVCTLQSSSFMLISAKSMITHTVVAKKLTTHDEIHSHIQGIVF